jgi:hypothetical protein
LFQARVDFAGRVARGELAHLRGIVERFRAQTSVLAQSEIHPRARLKTVASI